MLIGYTRGGSVEGNAGQRKVVPTTRRPGSVYTPAAVDAGTRVLTDAQRDATLERFAGHRRVWDENPALRLVYKAWYERIASALGQAPAGRRVELGSGPGFARAFIPDLELTDLVRAPWHDRELSASELAFEDGSVAALVLFDVLHHLPSPRRFFTEADRVLMPGGRVVLCEPYIGPLSYPIYKFLHDEPLDLHADPLRQDLDPSKDPFDSNQAIPTVLFGRQRREFEQAFPDLEIASIQKLAGPSYPASGGFSRRPLLPLSILRGLLAFEERLPQALFRLMGFRLFVVLRKRAPR
jgi:SAM-dependent methyltransferase